MGFLGPRLDNKVSIRLKRNSTGETLTWVSIRLKRNSTGETLTSVSIRLKRNSTGETLNQIRTRLLRDFRWWFKWLLRLTNLGTAKAMCDGFEAKRLPEAEIHNFNAVLTQKGKFRVFHSFARKTPLDSYLVRIPRRTHPNP
ncbi:hypothetical protein RRG08_039601 [Elysia crispata]|uniref:Uncharacterized protein n=1 Tax=Elysia crispata TaxID=231223 RepID=A0AAE1AJV5_9GAST|nr:hypothetical protein RRG08_039601 [Elysia crispata]